MKKHFDAKQSNFNKKSEAYNTNFTTELDRNLRSLSEKIALYQLSESSDKNPQKIYAQPSDPIATPQKPDNFNLQLNYIKEENSIQNVISKSFVDTETQGEIIYNKSEPKIMSMIKDILQVWQLHENLLQTSFAIELDSERQIIVEEWISQSHQKQKKLKLQKSSNVQKDIGGKDRKDLEVQINQQKLLKKGVEAKQSEISKKIGWSASQLRDKLIREISADQSKDNFLKYLQNDLSALQNRLVEILNFIEFKEKEVDQLSEFLGLQYELLDNLLVCIKKNSLIRIWIVDKAQIFENNKKVLIDDDDYLSKLLYENLENGLQLYTDYNDAYNNDREYQKKDIAYKGGDKDTDNADKNNKGFYFIKQLDELHSTYKQNHMNSQQEILRQKKMFQRMLSVLGDRMNNELLNFNKVTDIPTVSNNSTNSVSKLKLLRDIKNKIADLNLVL